MHTISLFSEVGLIISSHKREFADFGTGGRGHGTKGHKNVGTFSVSDISGIVGKSLILVFPAAHGKQ